MAFIKAIGYSLVAGIITVLVFFWGTILAVVTTVGTILLMVFGVFTGIYFIIWDSQQNKKDRDKSDSE